MRQFYSTLSSKKILLTGGTGFIGKNILLYLQNNLIEPELLTIVTRDSNKFKSNYPEFATLSYVDYYDADILNLEYFGVNYDFIIHAATSVLDAPDSVRLCNEIIIGTQKVLEFAYLSGVKNLVNLSSGAVYGSITNEDSVTETHNCRPRVESSVSSYGLAKLMAEHYCFSYAVKYGINVVSLRCFCFGGAYLDRQHFVLGELIDKALKNDKIIVNASNKIYRSYMSTNDLVEWILYFLINSQPNNYEVYNVGSDQAISIPNLAYKVVQVLNSKSSVDCPNLDSQIVSYYVPNIDKAKRLGLKINSKIDDIIKNIVADYQHQKTSVNLEMQPFDQVSNININDGRNSVSAIVACYNDGLAIPIMAQRLVKVFEKCHIDYEIIFVSNGSTDNFQEIIGQLSLLNSRIIGVTHSRSFEQTSQASFLNGMELSTKQACVLLDGDLQDPPELIEDFIKYWKSGYDIVYGVRYKRDAPWFVRFGSKVFYRLFDKLSSIRIPHDAGDFSLIDRRAVNYMLDFNENDVLIRGIRAYIGFKHIGIKYHRPERMFGKSSNNFFKLIMWFKKGIFAYSRKPLDWMTTSGFILVLITILLIIIQISIRVFFPSQTPRGLSTVILLILFFGSTSIFFISIIGEYVAKIMEETKKRPIYIRDKIIRDGRVTAFEKYRNDKANIKY